VLLVTLGLVSSLGAAGALAAVVASRPTPVPSRALPIRVAPATRTVSAGAGARFTVRVTRNDHRASGLSGRTRLRIRRAGLPPGSHASFSSVKPHTAGLASRPRTTLAITTAAATPPGTYEVWIRALRPHRRGNATVELVVTAPTIVPSGPAATAPGTAAPIASPVVPPAPLPAPPVPTVPDAFTIAGNLAEPLSPGTGEPLDLTLTNLESSDLAISNLAVEVSAVHGPGRGPGHPCEPDDFAVEQFSGAAGFTLPAASSATLGELGFDRDEWPAVSMLNRPVNQDGCKGAALSLSFTGDATEATP
jgi:hypothetical protein